MTRLAIIGIDGATYDIIRPMVADGELPHIARILSEGSSGELASTEPPITPPAWVSMMTGLNPGRHGVYHFVRRSVGSYGLSLVDSSSFAGRELFSLLSRRGWRVGGFAVPMTYPPFPVNGYLVSGIPMPMEGEGNALPSGMWDELASHLGKPYEPDVDYAPYDGKAEPDSEDVGRYAGLRDELFRVERERIDLMVEWLGRHPTDMFFGVLSITDRCQHYFWKFQDREHDGWSEEGEAMYREVIADSYRLADEAVGRIREAAGAESTIALVSDHGFGPFNSDFQVNRWLEQEGYLVFKPIPRWTLGVTQLGDALRRSKLGFLARLLPGRVARIPVGRPKYKRVRDVRDIDWGRTRAFAALYGICFNLKGREPLGTVEPGTEMESLEAEILGKLHALKNPEGKQAVGRVETSSDLYSGEHVVTAPDIQFILEGLSCLQKEEFDPPSLFARRKYAAVSGTHRMNGIFALVGEGANPGAVFEGMNIMDTTPTLLHAVGQAVPTWMEGRIAEGAFHPTWWSSHPPEAVEEEAGLVGAGSDAWSTADAAQVEESLKGLGYL